MNIGPESDPIEVPIPEHPGLIPASDPVPEPEPEKVPA
jgi:hypothetical protein